MNDRRNPVGRNIAAVILVFMLEVACGGGGRTVGRPDVPQDGTGYEAFEVTFQDLAGTDKTPGDATPDRAWDPIEPADTIDQAGPDDATVVDAVLVGCPPPGGLLITEILYDPAMSPDSTGEYFEVFNALNVSVDLRDLVLESGTEKHVVTSTDPLILPPGGYFLFAKSGDPALNGGISPGYVYSKITLTNTADNLSLVCDGDLVDKVAYNTASGWPKKTGGGVAMVLDPSGFDAQKNDDPRYWCRGFQKFGAGDFGSPGAPNEPCAATSCGDKVVQAWEGCDDGGKKPHDGCEPDCTLSPDTDGDGIHDYADNCPDVPNPGQEDADGDKVGDVCDPAFCGNGIIEQGEECDDKNKTPADKCENDCKASVDMDEDGVFDSVDNCPGVANPAQEDADGDKVGDACDPPDCGNGVREEGEACDDKNQKSGDGCSATCRVEHFEPGWVIVTEFLYNPVRVDDSKGEYIEIYNTTDQTLDLAGWVLDDGATEQVVLNASEGFLLLEPRGFLVLGRSDDEFLNGGVPVDYVYGSKFSMGEKVDRIRLVWNGVVIDQVEYAIGTTFPAGDGRSLSLDPAFFDFELNDEGEAWCATPDEYPLALGDYGTPGEMNPPCP